MKVNKEFVGLNVLYVEDDDLINALVTNSLNSFKMNVCSVENGEEGLNEFKKANYDLVISDINMPKMDGLEMSKCIRAISTKIPIILISGNSDSDSFLKSIEIGINGYLIKPINLLSLTREIARVMRPVFVEKELEEKNNILQLKNRELMIAKTINMISHQWKQPLATINAIASAIKIKGELRELGKQTLFDGLDDIIRHSKSLASVVDRFKTLSDDKQITEFTFSQILKKIDFMIGYVCRNNNIALDLKFDKDFKIKSNKSEFVIILIDIVLNSVKQFQKYPQPHNTIMIFSSITDTEVVISIQDNAGGFSEDSLANACEFYYSEDGLNSKGLGLYLAKTSLRVLIDGELYISNWEDGKNFGAIVSISIPLNSVII